MQNNTCHGQCYLMQKLKTQQDQEQQNFKINLQEGLAVSTKLFAFDLPVVPVQDQKQFSIFTSKLNPRDYVYILDRPPLFG